MGQLGRGPFESGSEIYLGSCHHFLQFVLLRSLLVKSEYYFTKQMLGVCISEMIKYGICIQPALNFSLSYVSNILLSCFPIHF